MEISGNIRKKVFENSLKQGSIFRLKGDTPFESEDYHIFIVLNHSPQPNEMLLLVNGTSKVEKKKAILSKIYHTDVENTTVVLEANSYSFITKPTIIDCNDVKMVDLNTINFNSNDIKPITSDELSEEDINKIISATLNSSAVSENIKQKINLSHN